MYQKNAATTYVLGLDIARDQTGFAWLRLDKQEAVTTGKWTTWGIFQNDKRNDKLMFLHGQGIVAKLVEAVRARRAAGYSVIAMIEHPVFGSQRAEQQYFLFQSVLAALHAENVNVTTVSPNFLKLWIKCHSPEAYVGAIKKDQIKAIYKNYTHVANPEFPRPDLIDSDDVYDAIYLANLGAIFAMSVPDYDLDKVRQLLEGFQSSAELLAHSLIREVGFVEYDAVHKAYLRKPYEVFQGFAMVPQVDREKKLKEVVKAFNKNVYRTITSKFDYLFNLYAVQNLIANRLAELDAELAKTWITTRGPKKLTKLDVLTPSANLLYNYDGKAFVHHGTQVKTWQVAGTL